MDNFYEPRQISSLEQTLKRIKIYKTEKQYQYDTFIIFIYFIVTTIIILGCLILLIIIL
jgi:hypothetical protein